MMHPAEEPPRSLWKKVRALPRDRSVREALFAFAISRTAVLLLLIGTASARHDITAPGFDPADPHPTVRVEPAKIIERLQRTLERGDSSWYMSIAQQGYDRIPFDHRQQHNWVFFPLYPLLAGFLASGTGEYMITAALLSNALFFIALVLLHKLVCALGFDLATADRTVFYQAIFPVSYFFSLPLPESLFLCLNLASFLAAAHGRWLVAALFGALSSATRLSGVILAPALALFYGQRTDRSKWGPAVCWLGLAPLGLLAFMLFLWETTGNPLACVQAVEAWERKGGFFLLTLSRYLANPLDLIEPWNFRALHFAAAVLALAATFFWARRKQWAFTAFTFLAILLPLSSGTLDSTARYVSVVFPVFIALGVIGAQPRVDHLIRVVFLILFGLMTVFYGLRFSFAAA